MSTHKNSGKGEAADWGEHTVARFPANRHPSTPGTLSSGTLLEALLLSLLLVLQGRGRGTPTAGIINSFHPPYLAVC